MNANKKPLISGRYHDVELMDKLVAAINQHERSLSQEELVLKAKTSCRSLSKRNWTMEFLYEQAGRTHERPELGSRFEDRVGEVLLEILHGMTIEHDKELPGMRGFKGGQQRVDFYIPKLKIIVEADGNQHLHGRDNPDKLDEIRANDRLKDEYAAFNGITLIRVPETLDCLVIKEKVLSGIRRERPRFKPLNPSNALNTAGPARRGITSCTTRGLPKPKRGSKGPPLADVYCRGCHERPSYKNRTTYLCAKCWDRSNELWLTSRALQVNEVEGFKEEIIAFIKGRGRYVWHSEVYLYLRSVSTEDLKKHNIKVAPICRDLGFFAPADDRITRETADRVQGFVWSYMASHKHRTPTVREVMKGTGLDHTTLWTYVDYEAYIAGLGGKLKSELRHRFRDPAEFLQAASEIVRKAGCRMLMTAILDELGVSYPAYLERFKAVRPEDIHEKAGLLYHGVMCGVPQISR